ncbi:uncharacterized protein TNCV_1092101 [Trichonephila clavipes]|nr:uncharacterized protein TNCV_1092101 [Trichonephila clavipes]
MYSNRRYATQILRLTFDQPIRTLTPRRTHTLSRYGMDLAGDEGERISWLVSPRCDVVFGNTRLRGKRSAIWVILTADNTVELHGFADASSLAYAAAIYCRQKHNGKIEVQLFVSKTTVAPVKQVSIPRLELCGAHLLSKLFKSVLRTLKHYTFDVFAWTDSKIGLSWLSSHPRKWKTFVANSTSEIMEVLPTKHWRHVPSTENPEVLILKAYQIACYGGKDHPG